MDTDDRQVDICDCTVAFATDKTFSNAELSSTLQVLLLLENKISGITVSLIFFFHSIGERRNIFYFVSGFIDIIMIFLLPE